MKKILTKWRKASTAITKTDLSEVTIFISFPSKLARGCAYFHELLCLHRENISDIRPAAQGSFANICVLEKFHNLISHMPREVLEYTPRNTIK